MTLSLIPSMKFSLSDLKDPPRMPDGLANDNESVHIPRKYECVNHLQEMKLLPPVDPDGEVWRWFRAAQEMTFLRKNIAGLCLRSPFLILLLS